MLRACFSTQSLQASCKYMSRAWATLRAANELEQAAVAVAVALASAVALALAVALADDDADADADADDDCSFVSLFACLFAGLFD